MADLSPDPKGSAAFIVFETNVQKLMDLVKAPSGAMSEAGDILMKKIKQSSLAVKTLSEKRLALPESGLDGFRDALQPLQANVADLNTIMADFIGLLNSRRFLDTWMIVMLVTFAEAYLEDALLLLLSNGFKDSSLPPEVVTDITKRWIKNLLRSTSAHTWINQLEKLGVTGFRPDIKDTMLKLWERRHKIVHTAQPEISQAASQEFIDALRVVNEFVETTDRFVLASFSKTVTAPASA